MIFFSLCKTHICSGEVHVYLHVQQGSEIRLKVVTQDTRPDVRCELMGVKASSCDRVT